MPRNIKLTPPVIADILARLAEGESLRSSCSKHGVKHSTFLERCLKDEKVADQYARARTMGYELMADELLSIADDGRLDRVVRVGKDGQEYETTDYDVVQRSKLMVETRKWMLCKCLPKIYGDRLTQEHTGPGGSELKTPLIIAIPQREQEEE